MTHHIDAVCNQAAEHYKDHPPDVGVRLRLPVPKRRPLVSQLGQDHPLRQLERLVGRASPSLLLDAIPLHGQRQG